MKQLWASQIALPKSCLIFPEPQSANFPLEGTSGCLLICKTLHEWCVHSLHNYFACTYGTCYFRNAPLCVHYSYCSHCSLIVIYSSSSQFIISKAMNQQFYALSFTNLILDISKPQKRTIKAHTLPGFSSRYWAKWLLTFSYFLWTKKLPLGSLNIFFNYTLQTMSQNNQLSLWNNKC